MPTCAHGRWTSNCYTSFTAVWSPGGVTASQLRCPNCRKPAQLLITETGTSDRSRPFGRRTLRLHCPSDCVLPEAHLARLADPMAC
jgi:hypothetical protein